MGKRRSNVVREPNGRVQRVAIADDYAPVEIVRLRIAATLGLRDAVWAAPLGWLYVSHKISAAQFGAGQWWHALAAAYSSAQQSPNAPRSVALEPHRGHSADPDTARGRREVAAHHAAINSYYDARDALKTAGPTAMRVVIETCEKQQMPAGVGEIEALRRGLKLLAALRISRRSTGVG
jgi:hypothetical protein